MLPLSQKDALPGPASQSFSAIMQNNFRGLNIQSQSVEVSQKMRAPPPLFSQNAGPGPANGEDAPQFASQLASQAYYEQMGSPDFITPVDQFQLEYEPSNKEARHQRSPARLSPNRIKRARTLGNPTDASLDQLQPQQDHDLGLPPPHGNRAHNPYAPPGGRRIVQRVVSPPCYRSVFRREEDDDDALAHWRTARQRLRLPQCSSAAAGGPIDPIYQHSPHPPLSRYRSDFREIGLLGSGNYSKVLRGRHRLDGREYAIKRSLREVSPESVEFSQFLQETQLLANIPPHPHIIQYFSSWVEPQNHGGMAGGGGMGMGIDGTTTTEVAGDLLFMQLEKCDVTLGTHASLIGRVPREPELLDILRQIASALEHLHSCCIVHLDVKPDNIFMLCPPYLMNENNGGDSTIEGEEEDKDEWAPPGTVYKLGDFGQAMHLDLIKGGARKGAGVGVTEGDCRYLPLEVMNSDYSALEKADIFALGATILDLAMGKGLPENGQLYQDLRAGKLPLLPTVPASLVKMIKSLMHPNPGKRPTAAQVLKSPLLVNSSNGTNASMKGKQPHTGLAAGATIDENKQSNTAV